MEERKRICFIDIETGGLSYRAPLIEIAAVAVEAGTYKELDTFDAKIHFDMDDPHLDRKSLGINKFTPSRWKYAVGPKIAAKNFVAFLRNHASEKKIGSDREPFLVTKLAAHNAHFDNPRLRRWCKKHLPKDNSGRLAFYPGSFQCLDTLQAADWFFADNQGLARPANLKLVTLAEYFGLSTPDHSALTDARTTVELVKVLAEFRRVTETAKAA